MRLSTDSPQNRVREPDRREGLLLGTLRAAHSGGRLRTALDGNTVNFDQWLALSEAEK